MSEIDRIVTRRYWAFIAFAIVLFVVPLVVAVRSTSAGHVAHAKAKVVHHAPAPDTREVLGVYPRPQGCDRPDMRFTTKTQIRWLCSDGSARAAAW